ncbi:glycosyltransferase [Prochlorococcus sp. AH-736-A21]|nr:glycosyltransferase [Prochlorococcus sp. AH-736-A21]
MKILIYLEQSKILNKMISQFQVNPGVGGTTYTSARLAIELQKEFIKSNLDFKITLFTKNPTKDKFFDMEVLSEHDAFKKKWDITLLTGNIIENIYKKHIKINSNRTLIWTRHPFDKNMIKIAKDLKLELVSVGKNQYLSNFLLHGPHNHIDNLFCAKRIRKSAFNDENFLPFKLKKDKNKIRIGYMGALVPSKGFHLIAENWDEISLSLNKIGKTAILEVIGGSDLYDFEKGHEFIPCDKEYGNKIYPHIRNEINKTIFFHGTLDSQRYEIMKLCDIALFNPRGHGEAFPASILEWMSLSIPVISCMDYGCADVMTYSKYLTINNEREIAKKLIEYSLLKEKEKMEFKKLSFIISNYFSSKQPFIINQWILLFTQKNKLINEYLEKEIVKKTILKRFMMLFKSSIYKFISLLK